MPTPIDDRYGASFDLVLYCSPFLEDARMAGNGVQFIPLVAQAVEALIGAGLGREMPAAVNNTLRALDTRTKDGEPNILGSPGLLRAEFDGPLVARKHAASHAASLMIAEWAELDDTDAARSMESSAGHRHHLSGDYDFMTHGQLDGDAAVLLADFDKELERAWKRRRPARGDLVAGMIQAEDAYRVRMQAALQVGIERLRGAVRAYTDETQAGGRLLMDMLGPTAGVAAAAATRERLGDIEGVLNRQRADLAGEVEAAEQGAQGALEDLEQAVARGGFLRGHKKELRVYVERVTHAFKARYAFDLIEAALVALSEGHEPATRFHMSASEMRRAMRAASAQLREDVAAVEERRLTPVQELVERPVLRRDELRALYASVAGGSWDQIPVELDQRLRHELAPLSQLLDVSEVEIKDAVVAATLPAFAKISAMSADDAFRWRCERAGRAPELMLRDLIDMAPVMCRYDRARLPDAGMLHERSFTMVGVPDRDTSFFAGTQLGTLVTTGETRHVTILQLKLGFPPSAIWGFDRHRRAFEEVRRAGVVAHDIFPGFPHELRSAWLDSGDNKSTPNGRPRQKRRKR